MKMTAQQFEAFGKWLTKSRITDACPLCGQKGLVASDQILFFRDEAAEKEMPIVYIRYQTCLNMQFFPAQGVGVVLY